MGDSHRYPKSEDLKSGQSKIDDIVPDNIVLPSPPEISESKDNIEIENRILAELVEFDRQKDNYEMILIKLEEKKGALTKKHYKDLVSHLEYLIDNYNKLTPEKKQKFKESYHQIKIYKERFQKIKKENLSTDKPTSKRAQIRYAIIMTGIASSLGYVSEKYMKDMRKALGDSFPKEELPQILSVEKHTTEELLKIDKNLMRQKFGSEYKFAELLKRMSLKAFIQSHDDFKENKNKGKIDQLKFIKDASSKYADNLGYFLKEYFINLKSDRSRDEFISFLDETLSHLLTQRDYVSYGAIALFLNKINAFYPVDQKVMNKIRDLFDERKMQDLVRKEEIQRENYDFIPPLSMIGVIRGQIDQNRGTIAQRNEELKEIIEKSSKKDELMIYYESLKDKNKEELSAESKKLSESKDKNKEKIAIVEKLGANVVAYEAIRRLEERYKYYDKVCEKLRSLEHKESSESQLQGEILAFDRGRVSTASSPWIYYFAQSKYEDNLDARIKYPGRIIIPHVLHEEDVLSAENRHASKLKEEKKAAQDLAVKLEQTKYIRSLDFTKEFTDDIKKEIIKELTKVIELDSLLSNYNAELLSIGSDAYHSIRVANLKYVIDKIVAEKKSRELSDEAKNKVEADLKISKDSPSLLSEEEKEELDVKEAEIKPQIIKEHNKKDHETKSILQQQEDSDIEQMFVLLNSDDFDVLISSKDVKELFEFRNSFYDAWMLDDFKIPENYKENVPQLTEDVYQEIFTELCNSIDDKKNPKEIFKKLGELLDNRLTIDELESGFNGIKDYCNDGKGKLDRDKFKKCYKQWMQCQLIIKNINQKSSFLRIADILKRDTAAIVSHVIAENIKANEVKDSKKYGTKLEGPEYLLTVRVALIQKLLKDRSLSVDRIMSNLGKIKDIENSKMQFIIEPYLIALRSFSLGKQDQKKVEELNLTQNIKSYLEKYIYPKDELLEFKLQERNYQIILAKFTDNRGSLAEKDMNFIINYLKDLRKRTEELHLNHSDQYQEIHVGLTKLIDDFDRISKKEKSENRLSRRSGLAFREIQSGIFRVKGQYHPSNTEKILANYNKILQSKMLDIGAIFKKKRKTIDSKIDSKVDSKAESPVITSDDQLTLERLLKKSQEEKGVEEVVGGISTILSQRCHALISLALSEAKNIKEHSGDKGKFDKCIKASDLLLRAIELVKNKKYSLAKIDLNTAEFLLGSAGLVIPPIEYPKVNDSIQLLKSDADNFDHALPLVSYKEEKEQKKRKVSTPIVGFIGRSINVSAPESFEIADLVSAIPMSSEFDTNKSEMISLLSEKMFDHSGQITQEYKDVLVGQDDKAMALLSAIFKKARDFVLDNKNDFLDPMKIFLSKEVQIDIEGKDSSLSRIDAACTVYGSNIVKVNMIIAAINAYSGLYNSLGESNPNVCMVMVRMMNLQLNALGLLTSSLKSLSESKAIADDPFKTIYSQATRVIDNFLTTGSFKQDLSIITPLAHIAANVSQYARESKEYVLGSQLLSKLMSIDNPSRQLEILDKISKDLIHQSDKMSFYLKTISDAVPAEKLFEEIFGENFEKLSTSVKHPPSDMIIESSASSVVRDKKGSVDGEEKLPLMPSESHIKEIVEKLTKSTEAGDRRLAQLIASHPDELNHEQVDELKRYAEFINGELILADSDKEKLFKNISHISNELIKNSNELALTQINDIANAIDNPAYDNLLPILQSLFEEYRKSVYLLVSDEKILEKINEKIKMIDTMHVFEDSWLPEHKLTQDEQEVVRRIEYRQAILQKRELHSTRIVELLDDHPLSYSYELLKPTFVVEKIDKLFIDDAKAQVEKFLQIYAKLTEDKLFHEMMSDRYDDNLVLLMNEMTSHCETIIKEINERKISLDTPNDVELLKQQLNDAKAILSNPPKLKESKEEKIATWREKRQAKFEIDIELAIIELRQAMLENRVAKNTSQFSEKDLNKYKKFFTSEHAKLYEEYEKVYKQYKLKKIDDFNLSKLLPLIGNYQVTHKTKDEIKIETNHESDARVKLILGDKGYRILHEGEKESTSARKLYLHRLQQALDEHKRKNGGKKPVKMEKLLGPEGLRLYEAAMKEEAATKAFRNAVFLRALSSYLGPRWKKKLILWIGGPSAAGKTYATKGMISKVAKALKLMPTAAEIVDNYVVTIDGGIEREVSQIRQATLQVALEAGYPGIGDLEGFAKGNLKDRISNAAKTKDDLSIAIPETFTKYITDIFGRKLEKQFKRFASDPHNLQIYSEVVSGKKAYQKQRFMETVAIMGASRAFLKEGASYAGITLNNFFIGCESKKYKAGKIPKIKFRKKLKFFKAMPGSFQSGKDKSKEAHAVYRNIQRKYSHTYDFNIVNDLLYVVFDKKIGKWRPVEKQDKDEGQFILITERAFDSWKKEPETGYGIVPGVVLDEEEEFYRLTEWLKDPNGGKKSTLTDSILELYIDGVRVDLEAQNHVADLMKLVKKSEYALSLVDNIEHKTEIKPEIEKKLDILKAYVGILVSSINDQSPRWKDQIKEKDLEGLKTSLNQLINDAEKIYYEKINEVKLDKNTLEAAYQQLIVEKALETKNYRFDTQGHLITVIKPSLEDLRKMLINLRVPKDIVDNLNEARARKLISDKIGPITERVYCSIDIIGHPRLQDEFKSWLLKDNKEIELSKTVDKLLACDQRSSINALQKEMEMHMRLSSRVLEEKLNISPEVWEMIREETSSKLNDFIRKKFQEALLKCYQSDNINIATLNKKLDEYRKECSKEVKKLLLQTMLKKGISKENIEKLLKSLHKHDFEHTSATGFDYIHTDNRNESIVRITGTTETAHHKREGADTVATRQLHRCGLTFNKGKVSVFHDQGGRIEVRAPSIAYNKLSKIRGIDDVADKLDHITTKHFKDYTKPIIYNLLTSFYTDVSAKTIDRGNKQTLSCEMILKGSHAFNKKQLDKKGQFVFVQNIPINGHGSSLASELDVIVEAKLMSEISMLYTLSKNIPHPFDKKFQDTFKLIDSCYRSFLAENKDPNSYFKDSLQGQNARKFLDQIKPDFKMLINFEEKSLVDMSIEQIAALALARIYATNDHLNLKYGITIQTLSVFLEEASIAGCKSANERYQSISGRVDLLKSISRRDPLDFSPKEYAFIKSLKAYALGKGNLSDIESLRRTLDQAYNEHNLQGAASAISEEDQGATSKVKRFVKNLWGKIKRSTNTNIAESEYLTNLSQNQSGSLQAHSVSRNKLFRKISQITRLRDAFKDIFTVSKEKTQSSKVEVKVSDESFLTRLRKWFTKTDIKESKKMTSSGDIELQELPREAQGIDAQPVEQSQPRSIASESKQPELPAQPKPVESMESAERILPSEQPEPPVEPIPPAGIVKPTPPEPDVRDEIREEDRVNEEGKSEEKVASARILEDAKVKSDELSHPDLPMPAQVQLPLEELPPPVQAHEIQPIAEVQPLPRVESKPTIHAPPQSESLSPAQAQSHEHPLPPNEVNVPQVNQADEIERARSRSLEEEAVIRARSRPMRPLVESVIEENAPPYPRNQERDANDVRNPNRGSTQETQTIYVSGMKHTKDYQPSFIEELKTDGSIEFTCKRLPEGRVIKDSSHRPGSDYIRYVAAQIEEAKKKLDNPVIDIFIDAHEPDPEKIALRNTYIWVCHAYGIPCFDKNGERINYNKNDAYQIDKIKDTLGMSSFMDRVTHMTHHFFKPPERASIPNDADITLYISRLRDNISQYASNIDRLNSADMSVSLNRFRSEINMLNAIKGKTPEQQREVTALEAQIISFEKEKSTSYHRPQKGMRNV